MTLIILRVADLAATSPEDRRVSARQGGWVKTVAVLNILWIKDDQTIRRLLRRVNGHSHELVSRIWPRLTKGGRTYAVACESLTCVPA